MCVGPDAGVYLHCPGRWARAGMAETVRAHRPEASEAERFRLLVEAVTDYAIYMLDPAGIVTSWNPGAERIKGYSAAEIVGRSFTNFYEPADRKAGIPQRALQDRKSVG